MALKRIQIPSPNHSSRGGASIRLIVLHTAEGALTIQSLGSFFANPASQVSSHAGADDTPNTIGQYVQDSEKAWTVAAFNPESVNLEMCAFASWSTVEWLKHPHMLANCAAWIREEAKLHGIPIVKLTDAEAQGNGRGVCQHSNLGAAGGGHHDCGPGFPIDLVLDMARTGPPKPEDYVAVTASLNAEGALHVFVEAKDGSVWYTWQNKGDTGWHGGGKGAVAGLVKFAAAP